MNDALLLTAEETAATLKVSVRQLRRLKNTKRLPAPVKLGKRPRWCRQELIDWINAGCPRADKWAMTYRP